MSQAPFTIESLCSNQGQRSVTRAVLPPGAKSLKHYHTQFEETFQIHEGELIVGQEKSKFNLSAGKSSPKINRREIHFFDNLSERNVVIDIILEPGHVGCENVNKILAGLEKDGKIKALAKFKGYNALWMVIADMTDTLVVGMPKQIFRIFRFFIGTKKIEELKAHLVDKYCKTE